MTSAFRALLLEGVKHFARVGYIDEAALSDWMTRLHAALDREIPTDEESRVLLGQVLESVYTREVKSGLARRVPGVSRYTLDRVAPYLRAELDRRIFAGVDLIRLNKRAAVEGTLKRFSGWVSSVPPGGSVDTNHRAITKDIGKSVARLKFEARRVAIDQAAKLGAAVARTVAEGEGAIAAIWHDRGEHDRGYDARPEHLKRSGRLFLIRDSWAMADGLVKKAGGVQYTDEVTEPAIEIFCSCWYEFLMHPSRLPAELLTAKGRMWVNGESVRSA